MIDTLALHDVRVYPEASVTLQARAVHVFIAPNDAGKTTLRLAIEYLLAGRALGVTDEAGRGAEALIRAGADKAVIEALLVDRDGQRIGVRRTLHASSTPMRLEVQGAAGSTTVLEKVLGERIGAGPETVALALHPDRFLSKSHSDQQAVIARLGPPPSLSDVRQALLGTGLAQEGLGLIGTAGLPASGMLDEIEKRARAARQQVRKDRDEATGASKALSEAQVCMSDADVAAAKKRLAVLEGQRDEAQREVGRRQSLAAARVHAQATRKVKESDLEAARQAVARYSEQSSSEAALNKAAAQADAACVEAEAELHNAVTAAGTALERRNRLQLACGSAEAGEAGHCPLCPEIECSVDPARAAEALRTALDAAAADLGEAIAARERAQKALDDATGAAREARRRSDAALGAADALQAARKQEARLAQQLADLDASDATPEPDASEVQASLTGLLEEIGSVRSRLSAHEAQQKAADRATDAGRRAAEAGQQFEKLDALCAEFTSGRLRARLAAGTTQAVLADANAVLDGQAEVVQTEAGLAVRSAVWGGHALSPAVLSRSMRLRVGVAIQHALCRLTEFPLLVIDDADALDAANRSRLLGTLLDLREMYGQVIVLAAQSGPEPPGDPGLDGLCFWTIHDGQIERCGAVAPA